MSNDPVYATDAEKRELRDRFAMAAPPYPFKEPAIVPGDDPMRTVARIYAEWHFAFADACMDRRAR